MKEILAGLDPAQRQAVLAGQGLVRVMAGAGTGKTRVLTTRLVYLSTTAGVDPSSIVATTFTNKAAREMEERARSMGGDAVAGARISTLHALAARLLRRHPAAAGLASARFIIADDGEVADVMEKALDASGVMGPRPAEPDPDWDKAWRQHLKACLRVIGRWKENGLHVDEVRDPSRPRRRRSDEDMALVYSAYQEELGRRGLVDFGDLTMESVRLLERHPDILAAESSAIRHMMVDEFQDTNRIQLRLIALLASHWGNLMVVGDDDQSLYSFRGAIANLMERVVALLDEIAARGVTDVLLSTNRRCTDDTLLPANTLVDRNARAEAKVLRSGRAGAPVSVTGHPSDDAEGAAVAKAVADLIAGGADPDSIAILGRTSYVLDPVGRELLKRQVPHCMQAGTGFLERSEVRDILAYLKLAMSPALDTAFARIVARPTRGLGQAALTEIVRIARARDLPFHEALAALSAMGALKGEAGRAALLLGQHLSTLAHAAETGEPSEEIVRYVVSDIGYADWARAQKDAPKTLAASISGLMDMARAQPSFIDFLTDICLLADPEERAEGGVHVGTLHGSKGLEWDHVFIVGVEEGVLPSQRALEEAQKGGSPDDPWNAEGGGGIEEERRLLHVGLTRAKLAAYLSFAAVRGRGTLRQPARPSRFLREAELKVPKVTQTLAAAGAQRAKGGKPFGGGKSKGLW